MRSKLQQILIFAMVIILLPSATVLAQNFHVTTEPGENPNIWVYTLFNNDATGEKVILGMDLWWSQGDEPGYWNIVESPEGWVFVPSYPFPVWDAPLTNDPTYGNSLTGFVLETTDPALNFRLWYDDWATYEDGLVEVVPEPASMTALFAGLSGLLIARRRKS